MNRARMGVVVVVVAVVAAVATSVAVGSSGAGGTLTARLANDYLTFDIQAYNASGFSYAMGGYDRLVENVNGKLVPYLASKWVVKPKQVTFTLGQGARCTNGVQVTPKIVAASLQREIAVPKVTVNLTKTFGPGPLSVSYDMKKWTVTLKSQTPYSGLLNGAALPESSIMCPNALANPSKLLTEFLGSGPYALVSAVHQDQVVLKLRHNWTWGPVINGKRMTWKDLPETQVWRLVNNETTTANLLVTGDIDITQLNAGPNYDRVNSDSRFYRTVVPTSIPTMLTFNHLANRVTSDEKLRAAIGTAVNPSDWNQAIAGGLGVPVTSFIATNADCYDPKTKQLYPTGGIAKAKQILTQAGYTGVGSNGGLKTPDGKPVKLDILVSVPFFANIGDYLLNIVDQLGADGNLQALNGAVVTSRTFQGNFDISLSQSVVPPGSSAGDMGQFYGKQVNQTGGVNYFGPGPQQDPKWTSLVRLATQRSGTCKYWNEVQEYALQNFIFLPVVQRPLYVFAKKSVKFAGGGATVMNPILITFT